MSGIHRLTLAATLAVGLSGCLVQPPSATVTPIRSQAKPAAKKTATPAPAPSGEMLAATPTPTPTPQPAASASPSSVQLDASERVHPYLSEGQTEGMEAALNGLVRDAAGQLWVAHRRGWVSKYSAQGSLLGRYRPNEKVGDSYPPVYGLALDAAGRPVVATAEGLVMLDATSGEVTGRVTLKPDEGTEARVPQTVAIDAGGTVWATAGLDVWRFGADGALIGYDFPLPHAGGGSGQVVAAAFDALGRLWTAEGDRDAVSILSATGTLIKQVEVGDTPLSVRIDARGHAWSANHAGSVAEIGPDGTLLRTLRLGGSPCSLAIDAAGDVWVCHESGKVSRLGRDGSLKADYHFSDGAAGIVVDEAGTVWVAGATSLIHFKP